MVDRAMLFGGSRLGNRGTTATVDRFIAVNLLKQRIAAIGAAAMHHAKGTTLANLGADGPARIDRTGNPHLPEPGGSRLGGGAT
jgi:hypothetical protein